MHVYDLQDSIVYQSRLYTHFGFEAFLGGHGTFGSLVVYGRRRSFLSCQEARFDFMDSKEYERAQVQMEHVLQANPCWEMARQI